MRIRSPKDFWSGLIFVAIAFGFIGLARGYNIGNMHRMGPALFPIIIGTLLAGLGLIIAGRAFVIDGPPVPRFFARPILVSLLAMVLFGIALQWLGLIAAIAALVFVGSLASRESRILPTAALAAALIVFSVGIFVFVLGLPIPLWPGE
jgi:putative tricarboxylic transport membrane protein